MTANKSLYSVAKDPKAQKGQMVSMRMHSKYLEEVRLLLEILSQHSLAFPRMQQCLLESEHYQLPSSPFTCIRWRRSLPERISRGIVVDRHRLTAERFSLQTSHLIVFYFKIMAKCQCDYFRILIRCHMSWKLKLQPFISHGWFKSEKICTVYSSYHFPFPWPWQSSIVNCDILSHWIQISFIVLSNLVF